ncbi:MAG: hypothetical protein V1792_04830 [Pseudomonadota bacterium]
MVIRLVGGILAVLLALAVYSWALLALLRVTGNPFGCAILLAPSFYVVLLAGGILLIRSTKTDTTSAGRAKQALRQVPCDSVSARQRWMLRAQKACAFVVGFIVISVSQTVMMLGIPHLIWGWWVTGPGPGEIIKGLCKVIFLGLIWVAIGTLLCCYSICYGSKRRESDNALMSDLCSNRLVRWLSQLPPPKLLNLALGVVCYWVGLDISSQILFAGQRFGDFSLPGQLALVLIPTMFTGTVLSWRALKADR